MHNKLFFFKIEMISFKKAIKKNLILAVFTAYYQFWCSSGSLSYFNHPVVDLVNVQKSACKLLSYSLFHLPVPVTVWCLSLSLSDPACLIVPSLSFFDCLPEYLPCVFISLSILMSFLVRCHSCLILSLFFSVSLVPVLGLYSDGDAYLKSFSRLCLPASESTFRIRDRTTKT